MSLREVLSRLELDRHESHGLVNLLMASAASLRPHAGMDITTATMLQDIAAAASRFQPNWNEVLTRSFLWHGPLPHELMTEALPLLRRDATEKSPCAVRATRHSLLERPALAEIVGASKPFTRFIHELLPAGLKVCRTSTFYHYYNSPEDLVEPHLDTGDFALSCLVMLHHTHCGNRHSRFYLCPPSGGPLEISLDVGDALVFFSGTLVHARSAPGQDESVVTASWGFRLDGE